MLKLDNIRKDYLAGDNTVHALKGVSIEFRKSEFVSILGASGCGKTTMLNIIGGLDKYTSGDLIINGVSTKQYKDKDWDAYRNSTIGFVFQSYNLIPHLTVLGNVELALSLTGIKAKERKERAEEALKSVGLGEQIYKKPNQLSGGQMQRVAIARALVNNPDVILADEPTGALDTDTSVQIMDILKEISHDRLIIMVTHNPDLAEKYSSRIIRLLDGEIMSDTNPINEKESLEIEKEAIEYQKSLTVEKKDKSKKKNKTSMSYFTALGLSLKNLITKKGRTFMTSFAGSIGIIGIALVLAISNGFNGYISKLQSDTLGGYPITISRSSIDYSAMQSATTTGVTYTEYPSDNNLVVYDPNASLSSIIKMNVITKEYVEYIDKMDKTLVNEVSKSYSVPLNVLTKNGESVTKVDTSVTENMMTGTASGAFFEGLGNAEFVNGSYDVIYGSYPKNKNELAIVVDTYNRLSKDTLTALGIEYTEGEKISFADLVNKKEYKLVLNDDYYTYDETTDTFTTASSTDYATLYDSENNITLSISGVLRLNSSAPLDILQSGIMYLPELTESYLSDCKDSLIVEKQSANDTKVYSPIDMSMTTPTGTQNILLDTYEKVILYYASNGTTITADTAKEFALQQIGGSNIPSTIYIYPKDFNTKSSINAYLDAWNDSNDNKIYYTDAASVLSTTMGSLVNIISYVLIAFAAVSLIVSSIMISIITYASVIERTKEIGVLRSIGARKRDISRVFNAETMLIGFCAGLIGVVVTYLLCPVINIIISAVAGEMFAGSIAVFNPLHALTLIIISVVLTFISGLIPSSYAAKKDPVVALRSE